MNLPRLVITLILNTCFLSLYSQELVSCLVATDYRLSADDTCTLAFDADVLAFFKDNEYDGDIMVGYTLPGARLQPRITWQPLDAVRMEAGVHALIYDGANKYPCFAYHNIPRWKGDQYQSGAHLLPFLRVQAEMGCLNFVLGTIYGGANHRLVEPLMNPEINLSQDPEMGFQVFVDLPRYHLDAWINWQSFIFRGDTHEEALNVGLSHRIALNAPDAPFSLYLPVDILIQHYGGEIDSTDMDMETFDNAALGLGLRWNAGGSILNGLTAEALTLACWQQWGHRWPFDHGFGASLTLSADLLSQFRLFATTLWARNFCSLYGSPFFSTFSADRGRDYSHILSTHLGAEWSRTFAPGYIVGAKLDTYLCSAGHEPLSNNLSFGFFLRCSPHFVLKRFIR